MQIQEILQTGYVTDSASLSWLHSNDYFKIQSVLSCVKVRLSFYGDLGLRFTGFGRDQYRSPEVVFREIPHLILSVFIHN